PQDATLTFAADQHGIGLVAARELATPQRMIFQPLVAAPHRRCCLLVAAAQQLMLDIVLVNHHPDMPWEVIARNVYPFEQDDITCLALQELVEHRLCFRWREEREGVRSAACKICQLVEPLQTEGW